MVELKDLLEIEGIEEILTGVSTPEELAKILDENSVELEDGVTVEEAFAALKNPPEEELNADALDDVSGGVIGTGLVVGGGRFGAYSVAEKEEKITEQRDIVSGNTRTTRM